MNNFEYANPKTLKDAAALLGSSWDEAAVLAGGTDLISLMKDYIYTPKRVVNIKGLKELGGIQKTGAGIRIGSAVTLDELAENAIVRAEYPALVHAARGITSPQIRNMGTVGGDLCQRPRCWYYRNGFGLLALDKGGQSMIPAGENQYHAIFGGGSAHFVSASNLGPALVALGARVKVASAAATREIAADKFFVTPQNANAREIALLPNEIVTEVIIPATRTKNATYEVREREAVDWPLVAAAVSLVMKGTTVESARVVLGHVAPTPHVAVDAEKMLAGKTITAEVAAEAGKAATMGAKPLSANAYKVHLTSVAVKRALLEAAGVKA